MQPKVVELNFVLPSDYARVTGGEGVEGEGR